MRKWSVFLFASLLVCGAGRCAWADGPTTGTENPEDFRLEVTGSAWILNSAGRIQDNGAPVDLVSDLGARQDQPTFYGQLVFKPTRKQRIVVEGTPFRITGYNNVDRTVSYGGRTFNVSQTLSSSANINYVFAGYQYDVLSGPMGHLGFSVGAAYLGATGTIDAVQSGLVASKSLTISMPLAGTEFRVFPIRNHRVFEVDGGMRGMGFGSYGHYVEAVGQGGICIGPLTFLGGYRGVNLDLHDTTNGGSGVSVRLQGPIFSLLWRW